MSQESQNEWGAVAVAGLLTIAMLVAVWWRPFGHFATWPKILFSVGIISLVVGIMTAWDWVLTAGQDNTVGARCDECDAVIHKGEGYLYHPSVPADVLRMGFSMLVVPEKLLCSKCAARFPNASRQRARKWWRDNPNGSPFFIPDPDGPKSADEWLSQLSSSSIPVNHRVRIAYKFQYQYCEAVEEKLREVLIDDVALRKVILARYEAEHSADMSRLMGYIDEAAITAENEAARRRLPKDPAKLADTDLRILDPDELVKLIMSAGDC